MIGSEAALAAVLSHAPRPKSVSAPLLAALGHVAARDVKSPQPSPLFDNYAMDGFAFSSASSATAAAGSPVRLRVTGAVRAGDAVGPLGSGEAVRIMTGAALPFGADTVLPNERVLTDRDTLVLLEPVRAGENVRYRAEELKKGDVLLRKGAPIHAAAVGILAGFGIRTVEAYEFQRVAVIATGNELRSPGEALGPAQIYNSNSWMIHAALVQMGIRPMFCKRVGDHAVHIKRLLKFALAQADVVILSGGVSVGGADPVKPLLRDLGVRTLFWKVSQKPGKPLFLASSRRRSSSAFRAIRRRCSPIFTSTFIPRSAACPDSRSRACAAKSSRWKSRSRPIPRNPSARVNKKRDLKIH